MAVPTTRDCTLRAEWQCHPHGTARSGPSGSAAHTATRRRAYGLHALTLPLDVERTETVRPGPSGSVLHTELHAQGRVAVPTTLPLDVERTGSTPSHCHSTSNVPRRCAQARVAVPPMRGCALRAEWQRRPHCHSRRRAYGLHALTLPLDVERTEDVALAPGDLVHAGVMVLPRVVPGHPCLAGPMTSSGNVSL